MPQRIDLLPFLLFIILYYTHLCAEMQAVTKMADLATSQPDDFYANYINRDGPDMLVNLTILAIFMRHYWALLTGLIYSL